MAGSVRDKRSVCTKVICLLRLGPDTPPLSSPPGECERVADPSKRSKSSGPAPGSLVVDDETEEWNGVGEVRSFVIRSPVPWYYHMSPDHDKELPTLIWSRRRDSGTPTESIPSSLLGIWTWSLPVPVPRSPTTSPYVSRSSNTSIKYVFHSTR